MVIRKEAIKSKLGKLEEATKLLEKYRKYSKKDFISNPTISGAAKYNLILGIEIIVDIGSHILSEEYGARPEEYKDAIEMLGEYEVIPEKFAKENVRMTGFRNLLIHEYMKIDANKVYQNFQKAPEIFRKFAKYFQEFLDKI